MLDLYPTSTYAAWLAYSQLVPMEKRFKPNEIARYIHSRSYPGKRSVPLSPSTGAWKELQGDELAAWEMNWAQRILRYHPDFPFADSLRLNVAVNGLVVGNNNLALETLAAVSTSGKPEQAQWAREFVSSWQNKE